MRKILSLLVVFVLIASLFAGCGGTMTASTPKANSAPAAPAADMGGDDAKYGSASVAATAGVQKEEAKAAEPAKAEAPKTEKMNDQAITGSGTEAQSVSNAILSQRKVIRNANISVEVEDFEEAYAKIKSTIAAWGFVQETNIRKEKVYVDSKEKLITKGTIIIRVDKDKFESTLTNVKGLGISFGEDIKGEDVTDKFFDTESRLRLLRFEESRLEQYLNKINDPDIIFKTESRLTDIRHEIEGLTGTLKKWNDLVELSTITINLYEKNPVSNNIPVVKSYGDRLFGGFMGSMKGVVHFFGELLIAFMSSLPVLIVLGIIVWVGVVVYRRYARRNKISNNTDKEGGIQS